MMLVVALLAARLVGSVVLCTYDDAFISYRYARNLAAGHGLVYHPGEWVLGSTCPGFSVLVALFIVAGLPVVPSVLALNIVCDLAILGVTLYVLRHDVGWLSAALFGLFFAVSPILTRICIGGMEVNLFALCCVLSVVLYHAGRPRTAVGLAAAAYFLRPEAVVLVGILCLEEWLSGRRKAAVVMAVVALAVAGAPALAILHWYGHVLPQSVLAKSGHAGSPVTAVVRTLLLNDGLCWAVLPSTILGFGLAVKRGGRVRTLALLGGSCLGAYVVARPQVWSWYGEVVHHVQFVLAAIGVGFALGYLRPLRPVLSFGRVSAVGSALVVAFWAALWCMVGPSAVTVHVYAPMRAWCEGARSAGSSILAEDIGAIGYFSNGRIYDAAGLVWPEAFSYCSVREMIRDRLPTYVLLNRGEPADAVLSDPVLERTYERLHTFSPPVGARPSAGPFARAAAWRQEYILLGRRDRLLPRPLRYQARGAMP